MRKAFVCARTSLRLYLRSGRVAFPLLSLVGYPLLFYQIIPVDTVSSFAMSSAMAFAWGAWVASSAIWSEDRTLRQLFLVKAGQRPYFLAQQICLMLSGAAGGAFLILSPLLAQRLLVPDMFVKPPEATEAALGLCLNLSAGLCGGAFGALFHPRFIRDRKAAQLGCLLLGILGLVGETAGIPAALRALLPPISDAIGGISRAGALTAQTVLPRALYYLLYAACCMALQSAILHRTEE